MTAREALLVRVVAPHFCAGLLIDRDSRRCIQAAPILKWAVGKGADELRVIFDRNGWNAQRIA